MGDQSFDNFDNFFHFWPKIHQKTVKAAVFPGPLWPYTWPQSDQGWTTWWGNGPLPSPQVWSKLVHREANQSPLKNAKLHFWQRRIRVESVNISSADHYFLTPLYTWVGPTLRNFLITMSYQANSANNRDRVLKAALLFLLLSPYTLLHWVQTQDSEAGPSGAPTGPSFWSWCHQVPL